MISDIFTIFDLLHNTFFIEHGPGAPMDKWTCKHDQTTQSSYSNITFSNIEVAGRSMVTKCSSLGVDRGGCGCHPACSEGHLPWGLPNTIHAPGPVQQFNVSLSFKNVKIAGVNVGEIIADPKYKGWFNVTREALLSLNIDGKPALEYVAV